MEMNPKPELADWIERGLAMPKVVEAKTRIYPIYGRSGEHTKDNDDQQWVLGVQIPLHHILANALGLAFIGKIGETGEAWNAWKEMKYCSGVDAWFDGDGISLFFHEFLELTRDEATYIRHRFYCSSCSLVESVSEPLSAAEIAKLVRGGVD